MRRQPFPKRRSARNGAVRRVGANPAGRPRRRILCTRRDAQPAHVGRKPEAKARRNEDDLGAIGGQNRHVGADEKVSAASDARVVPVNRRGVGSTINQHDDAPVLGAEAETNRQRRPSDVDRTSRCKIQPTDPVPPPDDHRSAQLLPHDIGNRLAKLRERLFQGGPRATRHLVEKPADDRAEPIARDCLESLDTRGDLGEGRQVGHRREGQSKPQRQDTASNRCARRVSKTALRHNSGHDRALHRSHARGRIDLIGQWLPIVTAPAPRPLDLATFFDKSRRRNAGSIGRRHADAD
jgi:hypothetical protein